MFPEGNKPLTDWYKQGGRLQIAVRSIISEERSVKGQVTHAPCYRNRALAKIKHGPLLPLTLSGTQPQSRRDTC